MVKLENRHFRTSSPILSSILGGIVYGEPEVFLGELSQTVVEVEKIVEVEKEVKVEDKKMERKVEAYEAILFKKKIIIE